MARIRTIKPEFWDDEKISLISRDVRLLYIGMWTFSDDYGVVKGNSIWLKSKVFPYDNVQVKQFDSWLTDLERLGFISPFSHSEEKFYYLPNFSRHQKIDKLSKFRNPAYNKDLHDSTINRLTVDDQSPPEGSSNSSSKGVVKVVSGDKSPAQNLKIPIDDRLKAFVDEVYGYKHLYKLPMLDAFLNYWTEKNAGGTRMKFEIERAKRGTFQVDRRLITWKNNERKGGDSGQSNDFKYKPPTDLID